MIILKQWKLYLYIHHKVLLMCKFIHFMLYWQHIPYEKKTLLNHKLTMAFEVKLWYKKGYFVYIKTMMNHLKGVIWCNFKFSFVFGVLQAVCA